MEEATTDQRQLLHHRKETKTFVVENIDESTGEVKGEIEVEREVDVPSLVFQCNISIHSPVDFNDQPLTKMIAENTADEDLLNFAKDDLIKVLGDEYNKKKKKVANMDSLMEMRTNISR